jgi:hypothetical protein
VRDSWLKALTDLGYSPRFVSSEQIEAGELSRGGYKACVLPEAIALGEKELGALDNYLKAPNDRLVFCDGSPGVFDEHGKLRADAKPILSLKPTRSEDGVFALGDIQIGPTTPASYGWLPGDVAKSGADRLAHEPKFALAEWMAGFLRKHRPSVSVPLASRTAIFRYRLGNARLLAFERNIDYQMSEDLKQAGGNETLEKPVDITAQLQATAHVYDLRTGKYLGFVDKIPMTLDPWQPSLFALTAQKIAGDDIVTALGAAAH